MRRQVVHSGLRMHVIVGQHQQHVTNIWWVYARRQQVLRTCAQVCNRRHRPAVIPGPPPSCALMAHAITIVLCTWRAGASCTCGLDSNSSCATATPVPEPPSCALMRHDYYLFVRTVHAALINCIRTLPCFDPCKPHTRHGPWYTVAYTHICSLSIQCVKWHSRSLRLAHAESFVFPTTSLDSWAFSVHM